MPEPHEPALIVGAGPIGLACAISAKRRGIDPLVIDAGALANSIVGYPVGMIFFTTPERLEIGGHPLTCGGAKPTREEALKYYRGVARAEGIRVRTYAKLVGATRARSIVCELLTSAGAERLECDRLVLATGYFDHPNLLGVPGEDLPHVRHYFDEAHLSYGQEVVVIGGGNSAVDAALQLFRAGARVTVVYRGPEFRKSVKYWLAPDLANRIKAGEITAHLNTRVERIAPHAVHAVNAKQRALDIPADRVYALTGFQPDLALFGRMGIAYDPRSGRPKVDPATLETNAPGVYLAGSVTAGKEISEIFIENGRFDGDKIFGDAQARARAESLYLHIGRPTGE